jgi:hypothetical protein
VIVVKREGAVAGVAEVVPANPSSRCPHRIDRRERAGVVPQNPHRPLSGPIEDEMILPADVAVVEGEDPIGGIRQVVAADAVSGSALLIDRRERPSVVPQDPDRALTRPIEHEMIESAAMGVVKGEDPIGGIRQVVVADAANVLRIGSREDREVNHTYTAESAGFVHGYIEAKHSGEAGCLKIYSPPRESAGALRWFMVRDEDTKRGSYGLNCIL